MKTLGQRIILELARRRQLGAFFDYASYASLRRINSPHDLREFLSDRGYILAEDSEPNVVVDSLLTQAPSDSATWTSALLPMAYADLFLWIFGLLFYAARWIR